MAENTTEKVASSFRDPSGFVFRKNGVLNRQINNYYKETWDKLVSSGLLEELIDQGLLIGHTVVTDKTAPLSKEGFAVIRPEEVPTVSYPYEWSFSQYKDAALTTLEIQRRALKHGFSLKDASAYNIQFHNGQPVFIDTLSFEEYEAGKPWVAYRQYCQHFLAPLALMAKTNVDLSKLMRLYIDGIPLQLAAKLLPAGSKFKAGLGVHIHLHARSQTKHAKDGSESKANKARVSKPAITGLVQSLAKATAKLEWKPKDTEWGDYYTFTNYTDKAFLQKKKIIGGFIDKVNPKMVWDVGANNGLFSRIASTKDINTVAFDIDPIAVEKNYRQVQADGETTILPLVMDLTNPSPSLGWANQERDSMIERGPADMVFSLALIHHLAISNNLPLEKISDFFAGICKYLVMEFVPKGDSQVNILLATREDIFPDYTIEGFEKAFAGNFKIVDKTQVTGSKRTLYLLKKK